MISTNCVGHQPWTASDDPGPGRGRGWGVGRQPSAASGAGPGRVLGWEVGCRQQPVLDRENWGIGVTTQKIQI